MKLLTKFNLVLLVFFGISGFVISHMAYQFLMRNAREQVLQQAELMMASAASTRDYTDGTDQAAAAEEPGARNQFSAADCARVRRNHLVQLDAQVLSRLLVSRGHAQSHEPD